MKLIIILLIRTPADTPCYKCIEFKYSNINNCNGVYYNCKIRNLNFPNENLLYKGICLYFKFMNYKLLL